MNFKSCNLNIMCLCKIRFWKNCWLYGLYFDDVRIQVLWLPAPCVLNIHIYIKKNYYCFGLRKPGRYSASLVPVVRWWFVSPLGVFALSNPCLSRDNSSLTISESLGVVCAVESLRHPCQPFIDDLWVPRGSLHCRIPASRVPAVRWWFMSP